MTTARTKNSENILSLSKLKQTTCAYCGVGCGVDVKFKAGEPESVSGTADHPANFGKLCVKGSNLLDTTGLEGRLLHPFIDGQQVSWGEATNTVAQRFKAIIEEHGPDSVAFYLSGQLLTEDYYVANKLLKGYVGTANIDTNSRLCMSSAVAGYKRAFGEDVVPCSYDDLEQSELIIIVGTNSAWTHPILYQRIERAKQINPSLKVVVVDPRKTATTELGDLVLNLRPGSDAGLYNGLLNYIAEQGYCDKDFIELHTSGFERALQEASEWPVERVAEFCDLPAEDVLRLYQWFCNTKKAISFYSMGINQSSSGTDKCNAIINCHLATGKLLKPGAGPFSMTGQPNAMGGREVGGLANQLAAHMEVDNPEHQDKLQRFWQSPTMVTGAGKAAVEMFDDIQSGKIKAVWIMATNPMVSLPNRKSIQQALEGCELVVVSDCVAETDTLQFADIKLPATGWFEKNGTVTNAERRISRQRGIVPPQGEAKHDWQIICEVAHAMGYEGFAFEHPSEIFSEWAELTGFENDGERQLDISGLAGMTRREYDLLKPVQWPVNKQNPYGTKVVFNNNRFSTASGRANFIAIQPKLPLQVTSEEFPFIMNSGRTRDHWHTMTRTGKSARLCNHTQHPFIMVNPQDARKLGVESDDLMKVSSIGGEAIFPVKISNDVRRGETFAPIHWNKQFASAANVSAIYQPVVDPVSAQPESKQAAVQLAPAMFGQHVRFYSSVNTDLKSQVPFWLKNPMQYCVSWQIALSESREDLLTWCQKVSGIEGEWICFHDKQSRVTNIQCLVEGRVVVTAFAGSKPMEIDSNWIDEMFRKEQLDYGQIQSLLNAEPGEEFKKGKIVCNCFNVGEKQINEAVENGASSVEAVGEQLKCGTRCGSCRSEIGQLVKSRLITSISEPS
ncbi:molybdopterin-dependent oxidoreductase [Vibrio hannami]|uniref:nitrate reductase n=1 Tax=Vibrio hannami TaxID=2717094 RepID=UPI00240EC492|nr:nitrate reductase [Vibrio hannami]MDG3087501.1 molybdopterin-dependent oxidoreductase [Vibrio hannami]